ncbi:TlpA family protein disulfide reductase [Bartonella sp. W8125]|uniref:TlpA disulfide reductase family protein n=1 Tax=Bartonella TaxID=773 RepID=UPI0018DC8AF2|nr:TlpA disulfide reductase family protein [Bartonella choladocola]MBI0139538.1 TlpA family protein disulfide reductase [Bartonella choladocola]
MVARILEKAKFSGTFRKIIAKTTLGALSIYAIMMGSDNQVYSFPSLISVAHAEAASPCTGNAGKIDLIKQSANGFFKNMRFSDEPYDARKLAFKDEAGKDHTLAEFSGKTLLVNLWASWCVPCRTEMPELANLKRSIHSDSFDVMAINIDKTASDEKVKDFLKSIKADNIVFYRDQSMDVFNEVRKQGLAVGLPITMLIDKNGCLLGSYNGSAPWSNADSEKLMKAAMEADKKD